MLCDDQPWKSQEIQHLLTEEFDIEFHLVYLSKFLDNLGLSYSISRTKHPSRSEDAEEALDECVDDAFDKGGTNNPQNKCEGDDKEGWVVDDDVCTDGALSWGFVAAPHLRPWDNSHRLWYIDDPHIERLLVTLYEPAVGFYTPTGTVWQAFQKTRQKNASVSVSNRPTGRIRVPGFCSSWTPLRAH